MTIALIVAVIVVGLVTLFAVTTRRMKREQEEFWGPKIRELQERANRPRQPLPDTQEGWDEITAQWKELPECPNCDSNHVHLVGHEDWQCIDCEHTYFRPVIR